MNSPIQPTSWICRTCGRSNSMKSPVCPCGYHSMMGNSALLSLLEKPRAQVLSHDAHIIYNNVYNFAQGQGDTNILAPQGPQRTEAAQTENLLPEKKEAYWTFGRICLRMVTVASMFALGTIIGIIVLVIFLAASKMAG